MGGIDLKDQMLSSFPIERHRNLIWYKKLFRRLLNVLIHNSSVIHDHGRTKSDKLGNRSFRVRLLEEILETYCNTPQAPVQPTLPQPMHLPVKKVKKQRCKFCASKKVRRSTMWSCGTCQINLCLEGCYGDYHKELG
ncbi:unnamed protein product [Arctia plantaginis]|uniref:PiggyBac transposable element-derived protein 4 n=1 Tax=Arctia plantaginis TaxID=874455 RepID=A0A8S0ZKS3_ARCPL|nr:unnamed protein product [Arctia plantaginis]